MKSKEFFIVAAEESANQYAVKLIDELSSDQSFQGFKFSGIGFKSLKEKNFNLIFDAQKLSVMGAFEVLKKWSTVRSAFKKSINHIVEHKPTAVILIDFGGFNLKLAKEIKERSPDTKVLYFISPKLWAWGEKRVLKVKKYVDQMFVIHPFEVDFYKKWGVDAKFVGHPLLDELKEKYFEKSWIEEEKEKNKISKDHKVLGVMMGSRPSEITKHKEVFCKTIGLLKKKHNTLEVCFIIPPSNNKKDYNLMLAGAEFEYKILQSNEPMSKIALCDVCLVASGTATLQVGLLGVPMAIGYIMNPITMYLAKKYVKGVRFAGLVNIIKDKEVSKEFLQEDFQPEVVADYLNELLINAAKFEAAKNELLSLKKDLGEEKTYKRLKNELLPFV